MEVENTPRSIEPCTHDVAYLIACSNDLRLLLLLVVITAIIGTDSNAPGSSSNTLDSVAIAARGNEIKGLGISPKATDDFEIPLTARNTTQQLKSSRTRAKLKRTWFMDSGLFYNHYKPYHWLITPVRLTPVHSCFCSLIDMGCSACGWIGCTVEGRGYRCCFACFGTELEGQIRMLLRLAAVTDDWLKARVPWIEACYSKTKWGSETWNIRVGLLNIATCLSERLWFVN